MKNKILTASLIVAICGTSLYLTQLDILSGDTLLSGLLIATIAVLLRILQRQIASVRTNKTNYDLKTTKTQQDNQPTEITVELQNNDALRPSLSQREVILAPPQSNPNNWVNTPAHLSKGESVIYSLVESNTGNDIDIGNTYGKFNAQIDEDLQYLEVYDYFTNKQIGMISIEENQSSV